MSNDKIPSNTPEQLELPALDDPKAFDVWRTQIMRKPNDEFLETIEALVNTETSLGLLRAATLLTSKDPERSQILVSRALMSNDQTVHLMAKAQLAYLHARKAWSGTNTPQFDVQAVPLVLEEILQELKALRERTPLVFEAEIRTRSALADAYTLTQDFDKIRVNTAEVIILSQAIGLTSYALIANYQLAGVILDEGNAATAAVLYQQVSDDPNAEPAMSERATRARVVAYEAIGDDDAIEHTLAEQNFVPGAYGWAQTEALRFSTLRYPWTQFQDEIVGSAINGTGLIARINCFILKALSCSPEESEMIRETYRAAYQETIHFKQTAFGWWKLELQTITTYLLLKIDEVGLALQRLPSPHEIAKLPLAKQAFALCVAIEVLERSLPESAESLADTLRQAAECFLSFKERILSQVVTRLQLLTPLALALLARFPGLPNDVIRAGSDTIINVNARPIMVYKTPGMRPVQVVRYILQAFNIDTDFLGRSGGGQLQSLKQSLYHRYHHQASWYQPISAAQVNFALLCCRDTMTDNREHLMIQRSIKDLRVQNGYIPKLQKLEHPEELEQIETTLEKLEKSLITARAASQLLFGQGGV